MRWQVIIIISGVDKHKEEIMETCHVYTEILQLTCVETVEISTGLLTNLCKNTNKLASFLLFTKGYK